MLRDQTVEYLSDVFPQDVVTQISEGWHGRISEMFLREKCGILKRPLPGVMVMVQYQGVFEPFSFYHTTVTISDFAKGRSQ